MRCRGRGRPGPSAHREGGRSDGDGPAGGEPVGREGISERRRGQERRREEEEGDGHETRWRRRRRRAGRRPRRGRRVQKFRRREEARANVRRGEGSGVRAREGADLRRRDRERGQRKDQPRHRATGVRPPRRVSRRERREFPFASREVGDAGGVETRGEGGRTNKQTRGRSVRRSTGDREEPSGGLHGPRLCAHAPAGGVPSPSDAADAA